MKTKFCHFEIIVVLLLSVIPWPGPSVFKISCPRDRASMVRRIIQKRWIPILKKYQVELPLECPFHQSRDIFYPQQSAKFQHRTSQWTCGLCGKSFYAEKHLDTHFDSRHKNNVNTAEDAICLANYCDIMRCDVLAVTEYDSILTNDQTGSLITDIQVWREHTESKMTPFISCECRDLARVQTNINNNIKTDKSVIPVGTLFHQPNHHNHHYYYYYNNHQRHCYRDDNDNDGENKKNKKLIKKNNDKTRKSNCYPRDAGPDNKSSACDNSNDDDDDDDHDDDDRHNNYEDDDDDDDPNLVDTTLPPSAERREKKREAEIRKLKANCKPDELAKLKIQCEILVRDCIAGLLTNLSVKHFQEIEGELNRAVCWYLTCDRYWEDTKRNQRHTPWYLLVTFLFLLSSGISACYYVVSLLLSSGDDDCIDAIEDNQDYRDRHNLPVLSSSSSINEHQNDVRHDNRRKHDDQEENRLVPTGDMPDHYIYVTYPPELKRRLIESCYNRTTRL
ncbi:hypothetical protein HCN44_002207 [Aphidius gifuensis]|uniref:C2H2-type domain-containing protein n=1 Tax=Aphidius gifuensis TaxID=684658 RepID=A0A834Y228_APHGI|nr:uncharacterized protein LOC122860591 [Aphidius gifuensis]KAF7996561.1 hypothetical protein HCN44_002207 [Aphidius gifuensis]